MLQLNDLYICEASIVLHRVHRHTSQHAGPVQLTAESCKHALKPQNPGRCSSIPHDFPHCPVIKDMDEDMDS